MAIGQAHADGAAVFDQDVGDIGVGEHLAAALLDHRNHVAGDFRGAAHRVVAAVQIVAGDQRVNQEAGAGRGQAVVAPLPGEHGDQLRVVGELGEHLAGGAVVVAQGAAVQRQPRHTGKRRGQQLAGGERFDGAGGFVQCLHIGVDGAVLVRKRLFQLGAKGVRAGDQIVVAVTEENAVVAGVHGRPLQLAVGDVVEQPAAEGVAGAHVADVVDAHVPLVAVAFVAVV